MLRCRTASSLRCRRRSPGRAHRRRRAAPAVTRGAQLPRSCATCGRRSVRRRAFVRSCGEPTTADPRRTRRLPRHLQQSTPRTERPRGRPCEFRLTAPKQGCKRSARSGRRDQCVTRIGPCFDAATSIRTTFDRESVCADLEHPQAVAGTKTRPAEFVGAGMPRQAGHMSSPASCAWPDESRSRAAAVPAVVCLSDAVAAAGARAALVRGWRRARRGAVGVALVDAQRFGAVAAGGEDLHEQRVPALSVGRELRRARARRARRVRARCRRLRGRRRHSTRARRRGSPPAAADALRPTGDPLRGGSRGGR